MPQPLFNRRLMGWLLTLSLLVMTLPVNASWQCLNGSPCPPKCPMLTGEQAQQPITQPHCSLCPTEQKTTVTASKTRLCPLSQCVLKVRPQPEATLTDKEGFHGVSHALIVQSPEPIEAFVIESLPLLNTPLLCFYPQRFYRPHPARAPPTLL